MARWLNAPYTFWLLLALPAAATAYGYARGSIFYGEVLHSTGELGARLLIATLAVTPLSLAFPRAAWTRWLKARRRYLGVAAFGYSLMHATVYLERQGDIARIAADALATGMWTGWLALLVMLALAVTSNDASVRRLRGRWKWLHRGVYGGAALAFAHWILTAFDPIPGWMHLGVWAALESYRLWRTRRGVVR